MRTIHREIATAIIFSKDGRLLQGRKDAKAGGVYADGYWHIPGGGVHDRETKEQALIREIKEEVGLDISRCIIKLVDDAGHGSSEKVLKQTGEKVLCIMHFNAYRIDLPMNAADTHVVPGDDIVEYRWTDIKTELANLKITPPSVELFKRLGYL